MTIHNKESLRIFIIYDTVQIMYVWYELPKYYSLKHGMLEPILFWTISLSSDKLAYCII